MIPANASIGYNLFAAQNSVARHPAAEEVSRVAQRKFSSTRITLCRTGPSGFPINLRLRARNKVHVLNYWYWLLEKSGFDA
jgi:hypothetical protein